MQKRVTITLDEVVYDGLMRVAGRGTVSRFLAALARPHVLDTAMDAGCSAMGNDLEREAEASEWINGLIGDRSSAARCGGSNSIPPLAAKSGRSGQTLLSATILSIETNRGSLLCR